MTHESYDNIIFIKYENTFNNSTKFYANYYVAATMAVGMKRSILYCTIRHK